MNVNSVLIDFSLRYPDSAKFLSQFTGKEINNTHTKKYVGIKIKELCSEVNAAEARHLRAVVIGEALSLSMKDVIVLGNTNSNVSQVLPLLADWEASMPEIGQTQLFGFLKVKLAENILVLDKELVGMFAANWQTTTALFMQGNIDSQKLTELRLTYMIELAQTVAKFDAEYCKYLIEYTCKEILGEQFFQIENNRN